MDALDKLVEFATADHAKVIEHYREGYPSPVLVCKKWKDRVYVKDGVNYVEPYGEFDSNIPCSCGADFQNARIAEYKAEIEKQMLAGLAV